MGLISRRKPGRVAPYLHRHPDRVEAAVARCAARQLFHRAAVGPGDCRGRLYGLPHTGLWYEVGAPEMIAPTKRR
jgi:MurNAc alpha-1-phosphate uridylyltransferase